MPTSAASRHYGRLSQVRVRVKPAGRQKAVGQITHQIYAEADQICFGYPRQVAILFEDASLLLIDAGRIQALRGSSKSQVIARINAMPAAMRHHPHSLSDAGHYRRLEELCLATLNPPPDTGVSPCFNPVPPPPSHSGPTSKRPPPS